MESGTATALHPPFAVWTRLALLRAFCAVAEGAHVVASGGGDARAAAAACVTAVLCDAQCRVCVLGGRLDMRRSLGSVLGGCIVRFLGGLRGVVSRVIETHSGNCAFGAAVTRDGSKLLVLFARPFARPFRFHYAINVFRIGDGVLLRSFGENGVGPLQFERPCDVCVLADDHVLITETGNRRVQILTPALHFQGFVGVGQLSDPTSACGDSDAIVVAQRREFFIHVFRRHDGALLSCFGTSNHGDGQMHAPFGVCLIPVQRHIAVVDYLRSAVCVFTQEGKVVRRFGGYLLEYPYDITCSDSGDELIVADSDNKRVVVFSAAGELLKTIRTGWVRKVATHGSTIFALTYSSGCLVLT
jgi:DNA-binding beta-propeller fold protein YncE